MDIQIARSIREVPATTWDALTDGNPFQSHAFLLAMEENACVGPDSGWYPAHILLREEGDLVAAASAYVKTHSMGEYVYDFSWARAAEQHGIPYYPKLVVASPFSPVAGARLHAKTAQARNELAKRLPDIAKKLGCVGAHVLFLSSAERDSVIEHGAMIREGFQYQWHNQDYQSFDDYLKNLRSRRRKEVRRERRAVAQAGIHVKALLGHELTPDYVREIFHLYESTCQQYSWGRVYLNHAFFEQIVRTIPENIVFFAAYRDEELIAGAFCLRDETKLFGRYWGSKEEIPNLHFETSLYAPIEWAIREGIQTIEPGAGGEHKFPRGFLPTKTYSAHWHFHSGFHDALAEFCVREAHAVDQHIEHLLNEETPFQRK